MQRRNLTPYRLTGSSLVLLIAATPSFAETPLAVDIPLDIGEHEQVLRTGEVDHAYTTNFSQTITQDELSESLAPLGDVIGKKSGIQIRQSGGLGSFASVSLRGSTSEQVLIFLDGMLINSAAGGGVDLNSFSLSSIDSIDIYRGSTPLSLGSASIGGAININTRDAITRPVNEIGVAVGSFSTQQYNLFSSSAVKNWDYVVSAEQLISDNDYPFLNNQRTQYNLDDDVVEPRHNNHLDQQNLLLKTGYNVHNDSRLDVVTQWFGKSQGLPSWNNHPQTKTELDTERWQTQLRFINNNVGVHKLNMSNEIKYLISEQEYDNRSGDIGLTEEHSRSQTKQLSTRYYVDVIADHHLLGFNIELGREQYENKNLTLNKSDPLNKRDTVTAGIDYKLFLLQDDLIINPAVSRTWSEDSRYVASEDKRRHLDNTYNTPRLGAKYFLTSAFILKANIGRYLREPSFYELYGARGLFTSNTELRNEEALNKDIGFTYSRKLTNPTLNDFNWQLSYFSTRLRNQITRVFNSQGIGKSINLALVEITGIESILDFTLYNALKVQLESTWQDPINLTDTPDMYQKQSPGRYRQSHTLRLELSTRSVSPYYEHIYQTGMYYDTPNLLRAKDKELVNVGVHWKHHAFSGVLQVSNLTDQAVEDFVYYPQPGRSYSASVKYAFD